MRVHQWVKNVFVIAPVFFAQDLFDLDNIIRVLCAFIVFGCAASAIYLLNDLSDVESDRAHPVKKNRPIASGALSIASAKSALGALIAIAALGAIALSLVSSWGVALAIAGYVTLNLAYTFALKRIAFIDVSCIATGFVLRLLCGAAATGVMLSSYIVVVTFTLSLFLGFGKRYHEINQVADSATRRKSLSGYSTTSLKVALTLSALATIALYISYALEEETIAMFGTPHIIYTAPFVAVGIFRFTQLVTRGPDTDSPNRRYAARQAFFNHYRWLAGDGDHVNLSLGLPRTSAQTMPRADLRTCAMMASTAGFCRRILRVIACNSKRGALPKPFSARRRPFFM